jgi:hypothetical protein
MLAAQLIGSQAAKKREAEMARQHEIEKLLSQRAAQLGGNTAGIEAAGFNRDQEYRNAQSAISPTDLVKMYGAFNYGDDKSDAAPEREYPKMDADDWDAASKSRDEALEATSTPDWQGLNPEDDPAFRRRRGLI